MTGWTRATIGDACSVYSGGTPSKGNAAYWHGSIPWASAKDLKADRIFDAELHISPQACDESAAKIAPVGALLILVRGMGLANGIPIGEVTSPVAFNQDIRAIVPPATVDSRFLLLALRHSFADGGKSVLSSAAHGTLKIDADTLRRVEFPVPPLHEQRRIVAILDEAFDGVATAKANAEKNLQNARELFEGALDAALGRHDDGGQETTLGSEVDLLAGYAFSSKSYTDVASGIRLLRGDNIMQGYFRWDDAKGWPTAEAAPYARFALQANDVVLAMDRPWVAAGLKRAQIGVEDLPCLQVQRTARLRSRGRMDADFLFHLTGSRSFALHLRGAQTGIGVPHISGGQIESFRFIMPRPDKQAVIAGVLNDLKHQCERLEDIYRKKSSALDELKKSLLQRAFTGQLTSANTTPISVVAVQATISPEFSANVIALAYERHKRQGRERTFGHVKEQKLLHLVEAIAKVDLGREPMKDAAGPNDFEHMLKAENWARRNGFFEMVPRGGGYDFKKLSSFDELLAKAPQVLGAGLAKIEAVVDLLIPMDTEQAEVFATIHAAWNNLLRDGAEVTDAAIVLEARDRWHPDKLRIPESKFREAIQQIRSKGLAPDGTAKYVGGQTPLL